MAVNDELLAGRVTLELGDLQTQVDKANKILATLGQDLDARMKNAASSITALTDALKALQKVNSGSGGGNRGGGSGGGSGSNSGSVEKQVSQLKQMKTAYHELTTAYREYASALKTGNVQGQNNWLQQITKAKEAMANIRSNPLDKTSVSDYKQILNIYDQMLNRQAEFNKKQQDASAKAATEQQKQAVKEVATAYKNLTSAISSYKAAMKSGDAGSAAYWRQEIDASNQILVNTRQNIDNLGLEANQRKQVNDYIQKGQDAQRALNTNTKEGKSTVDTLASAWDSIYRKLLLISGISLVKIWRDALAYARDFDKAITDIAVITEQPLDSVRKMGDEYRNLASELQTTSTSIAEAATTIYRQGIRDTADIEGTITGITKFAAVTGLSVKEGIDVMTASMQNFREEGESAESVVMRIGDTWSYMGDAVATSGAKVAAAMSKASASVKAVGVSFEKASSWMAIMLARTQQAGEVVGTQMNALVARYAKITAKGYATVTSDDEGEALNFNDVSKALQKAGIQMYDVVKKTFLPMGEVMDQLAAKWGSLDEATQKYIATTLGGTRGMNYLLTLLNNYDAALELEAGVTEGVVNSKYDIWLEGVEAAQNNVKNSLEDLYSVMKADTLASFYNSIAKIVDIFTGLTKATDGMNIKFAAWAAGLGVAVVAIAKVVKSVTALSKAIKAASGLSAMLSSFGTMGWVGVAVAAASIIGTVVGLIANAGESIEDVQNRYNELQNTFKEQSFKAAGVATLIDELKDLETSTASAEEKTQAFNNIRKEIVADSPVLQAKYGEEGEYLTSYAEAAEVAAQKLSDLRKEMWKTANESIGNSETLFRNATKKAYTNYAPGTPKDYSWLGEETSREVLSEYGANQLEEIVDEMVVLYDQYTAEGKTKIAEMYNSLIAYANGRIIELNNDVETYKAQWLQDLKQGGSFNNPEIAEAILGDTTGFIPQIISDLESSDFGAEDLDAIENYFETVAEKYIQGLQEGFSPEIWNAIYDAADELWSTRGINTSTAASGKKYIDRIMESIFPHAGLWDEQAGEVEARLSEMSYDMLSAFYKAAKNAQAQGDTDFLEELFDNLLGGDEDAIKKQAGVIEEAGEIAEEAVTTFADSIDAAASKAGKAREALNSIGSGEELNDEFFIKLAEEFPQLAEAIKEYHDLLNGTGEFASDLPLMDGLTKIAQSEDFVTAIERIEKARDAIEKLSSGEWTASDISKIFADFPEIIGMDLPTAMEYLNGVIDTQSAKWSSYADRIGYTGSELKSLSEQFYKVMSSASAEEKILQKLKTTQSASADELASLVKTYPQLERVVRDFVDGTAKAEDVVNALNKAMNDNSADAWAKSVKSAVDAIKNAEKDTAEYNDAIVELSNAFNFQGMGDMSNFDFVKQNLDDIIAAVDGSAEAFQRLQDAAYINVFGTSSADFSAVEGGMQLVSDQAVALGNLLASIGLGTVETVDLTQQMYVADPDNPVGYALKQLTSTVQIWKPSSKNPFSKGGGGGSKGGGGGSKGGGGGGGSKNPSVSDDTSKLIDKQDKKTSAFDNELRMIQLQKQYHSIRGELQQVIEWTEKEAEVLRKQNAAYEESIKTIEEEIAEKEEEIANSKKGSKERKQAKKDLEELKKKLAEYNENLQENKNRLEEIEKEYLEYQSAIRQTRLDMEDLIRQTLQQQDELANSMLDNTVQLQDMIYEIIRKRYEDEQNLAIETLEKERDAALEAAEARKQAIQDEISEIDDLIKEREKLMKKEEEENEIAELQEKLARIAADPTRKKEALELQKQLEEKQKEAAWNAYKEELEAQKEALREESDNIDDEIDDINEKYDGLIEDINKKYEELFANPTELLKELQEVMAKSDEEILQWLKDNSDEWATYTEEKRQQTERDWQAILDGMHGITENYNDEVEEILKWTDEEILKWLEENNVNFKNATDTQREQFLADWKETLDAWRKAFEDVQDDITNPNPNKPDNPVENPGDDGQEHTGDSGGNGPIDMEPGGDMGGQKPSEKITKKSDYEWTGAKGKVHKVTAEGAAFTVEGAMKAAREAALAKAQDEALKNWQAAYEKGTIAEKAFKAAKKGIKNYDDAYIRYLKVYRQGGMNYTTGPAWLDGTSSQPERVLSAYQTQLFEDLINTLHMIRTINVSGLSSMNSPSVGYGGGANIEQIIVQVENLDTEDDYETLAQRVGDKLVEQLGRRSSVGGIRVF